MFLNADCTHKGFVLGYGSKSLSRHDSTGSILLRVYNNEGHSTIIWGNNRLKLLIRTIAIADLCSSCFISHAKKLVNRNVARKTLDALRDDCVRCRTLLNCVVNRLCRCEYPYRKHYVSNDQGKIRQKSSENSETTSHQENVRVSKQSPQERLKTHHLTGYRTKRFVINANFLNNTQEKNLKYNTYFEQMSSSQKCKLKSVTKSPSENILPSEKRTLEELDEEYEESESDSESVILGTTTTGRGIDDLIEEVCHKIYEIPCSSKRYRKEKRKTLQRTKLISKIQVIEENTSNRTATDANQSGDPIVNMSMETDGQAGGTIRSDSNPPINPQPVPVAPRLVTYAQVDKIHPHMAK